MTITITEFLVREISQRHFTMRLFLLLAQIVAVLTVAFAFAEGATSSIEDLLHYALVGVAYSFFSFSAILFENQFDLVAFFVLLCYMLVKLIILTIQQHHPAIHIEFTPQTISTIVGLVFAGLFFVVFLFLVFVVFRQMGQNSKRIFYAVGSNMQLRIFYRNWLQLNTVLKIDCLWSAQILISAAYLIWSPLTTKIACGLYLLVMIWYVLAIKIVKTENKKLLVLWLVTGLGQPVYAAIVISRLLPLGGSVATAIMQASAFLVVRVVVMFVMFNCTRAWGTGFTERAFAPGKPDGPLSEGEEGLIDWNSAFAFSTVEIVRIYDRLLGAMHHFLTLCILGYIVGYNIVYNMGFQATAMPVGTVRLQLKAPSRDVLHPPSLLAYCGPECLNCTYTGKPDYNSIESFLATSNNNGDNFSKVSGNNNMKSRNNYQATGGGEAPKFPTLNCLYMDEFFVGFPVVEEEVMLITTRFNESRQTASAGCPLSPTCSFKGPVHAYYVSEVEKYTLFIDHTMNVPEFGMTKNAYEMPGSLIDTRGEEVDVCAVYRESTPPLPCPSVVSLGVAGAADVIPMKALLDAANIDLDQSSGSHGATGQSSSKCKRYDGMVLQLSINYDNRFSFNPAQFKYTYTVREIPKAEFKSVERLVTAPDMLNRTLENRHGIALVVQQTGLLGQFQFMTLLINLVSGLGLFAATTTLVDILAIKALPKRVLYKNYKIAEVGESGRAANLSLGEVTDDEMAGNNGLEEEDGENNDDAEWEEEEGGGGGDRVGRKIKKQQGKRKQQQQQQQQQRQQRSTSSNSSLLSSSAFPMEPKGGEGGGGGGGKQKKSRENVSGESKSSAKNKNDGAGNSIASESEREGSRLSHSDDESLMSTTSESVHRTFKLTASTTMSCSLCGGVVAAGSQACWQQGRGIFHENCAS